MKDQLLFIFLLCLPGTLVVNEEIHAQDSKEPIQTYGIWKRHPEEPKIWLRDYYYRPAASNKFKSQTVVWYQNQPEFCYIYSPEKKAFWGRWTYDNPEEPVNWKFSYVRDLKPGVKPKELRYHKPGKPPEIPGTEETMVSPKYLPQFDD